MKTNRQTALNCLAIMAVAIVVAVILALLAFRFVKGVIKLGLLALIVVALIWFFANGVAR